MKLRNMFPCLPKNDLAHGRLRNPEPGSDGHLRHGSGQRANGLNVLSGDCCHVATLRIDGVRHWLKVIRVYAERCSTSVVELKAIGNRAPLRFVHGNVRTDEARSIPIRAVSSGTRSVPNPAPVSISVITRQRELAIQPVPLADLTTLAPQGPGTNWLLAISTMPATTLNNERSGLALRPDMTFGAPGASVCRVADGLAAINAHSIRRVLRQGKSLLRGPFYSETDGIRACA